MLLFTFVLGILLTSLAEMLYGRVYRAIRRTAGFPTYPVAVTTGYAYASAATEASTGRLSRFAVWRTALFCAGFIAVINYRFTFDTPVTVMDVTAAMALVYALVG
jgi:hypothetical protein